MKQPTFQGGSDPEKVHRNQSTRESADMRILHFTESLVIDDHASMAQFGVNAPPSVVLEFVTNCSDSLDDLIAADDAPPAC